jgi:hypothetical protein
MSFRPLFALAAVALVLSVAGPAAAHATAYSPDGKWKFVFGFTNEPAVTMTKNGLDLQIIDNATGFKIPDLQTSLKAEMHKGDVERELKDFAGQFNKSGYYTAAITPTEPGVYTLHLAGTINGSDVEIEIKTSHDVADIADTYFPARDAADYTELEARVAALEAKAKTQSETPTTTTKATSKGTPGFEPALLAGAVGVVVLALALRRR